MSTLYYESSLAHHGIKGQKWGVRRYQNPDGTLTSAGRRRLNKDFNKMGSERTNDISERDGKFVRDSLNSKRILLESYNDAAEAAHKLEEIEEKLQPIRTDKELRREYAVELAERFTISGMDHYPEGKERERIINDWMNGELSSELEYHYAKAQPVDPNVYMDDKNNLFDLSIECFSKLNKASETITKEILKENGFKKVDKLSDNYEFDHDTYISVNNYLKENLLSEEYLKKLKNHDLIG